MGYRRFVGEREFGEGRDGTLKQGRNRSDDDTDAWPQLPVSWQWAWQSRSSDTEPASWLAVMVLVVAQAALGTARNQILRLDAAMVAKGIRPLCRR